jgi:hypothetical protein
MTGMPQFTQEQIASLAYTVTELRQLAREHGISVPKSAMHHELVRVITAAGVGLPPKRGLRAASITMPPVRAAPTSAGVRPMVNSLLGMFTGTPLRVPAGCPHG